MWKTHEKLWPLAALMWMAGCGVEAPEISEPSTEQVMTGERQSALSDAQIQFCDDRFARDLPTPIWCGRRERAVTPPFDSACPDRQWIGYRLEVDACPAAPSRTGAWEVSEPFATARNNQLRRFCQYTWQPNSAERPEPPDVEALPDVVGLRLERDCDVVTAHATYSDQVSDLFNAAWAEQLQLPDWSAAAVFAAPLVRVAVIDAGYGGWSAPGNPGQMAVPHPVGVSSVIRSIACPDRGQGAFCAAETPNYNAMPFVRQGVLGELGGYLGTQAGYAAAVTLAVDEWLSTPVAQRAQHLILNLSLGWDGAYDWFNAQRLAGGAAYMATRYAACQGALLIAAAGNKATADDMGPLFPAAYEQIQRNCPNEPPIPERVYAPLVHAVGGVDGQDIELAVAREGAAPRLMAPAAYVIVPEDTVIGADRPTHLLTGTSMAAAAASGTAALLWSLRPGLSRDRVMQAIYRQGVPLNEPAEFGLGALQNQRRLSVGRAFQLVCPQGQQPGACPAPVSRPVIGPARAAGVDARPPFDQIVPLLSQETPVVLNEVNNPPNNNQESNYFAPYILPQPGVPACPICGFFGTDFEGQLDPYYTGTLVGDPTILVQDWNNDFYEIYIDKLPEKDPFIIDLFDKLDGIDIEKAWLQIPAVEDGKSVLNSSELFIY